MVVGQFSGAGGCLPIRSRCRRVYVINFIHSIGHARPPGWMNAFNLNLYRVSHGTSFLAPCSLVRRRLARVIHHHLILILSSPKPCRIGVCPRPGSRIFLSNKKLGLLTPGQNRSREIRTRCIPFYVHFPRFGRFSGAERAQRRARTRNRAKRVRGGMGVISPSMKTHRPTQGLGWCIETRMWIPAFVLWMRR